MSQEPKNATSTSKSTISYQLIGIMILVFLCGVVADQLIQNIKVGENLQFSTLSLIGFLFSIILGSASTVLAIAAIMLGKTSEQVMIQRSDDSIRLQNEVFSKTTDALQRIESSTGVTEKRLEDIIAGRVGDLSHSIANIAMAEGGRTIKDKKSFEEDIKKSILRELRGEKVSSAEHNRIKQMQKKEEQYKQFHSKALTVFANIDGSKAEKIGNGQFQGSLDDLFDGIFIKAGQRLGVCALGEDHIHAALNPDFLNRITSAIANSNVAKVYLVIDMNENKFDELNAQIRGILKTTKDSVLDSLIIIPSTFESLEEAVKKHLPE